MLFLFQQVVTSAGFGGELLRGLLRVEVSDFHTLAVENRALLLDVLRRNAVAVVNDALLIGPPKSDALGAPAAGRSGGSRVSRQRAGALTRATD